jgi:hypothetical protein
MPVSTFDIGRFLSRTCVPARFRPVLPALAAVAVAASVAGCGDNQPKFAPACPGLSLLRDAADLTRFRPGGRDVTDMVLDARITAVPAACSNGGPNKVKATLNVTTEVARGPAARGRTADFTYFVAVTEGGRVLDEQDYPVRATFPANTEHVVLTGDDIDLVLPVTREKSAAAYQIYVGFRLTPDELAYNRKRGPR